MDPPASTSSDEAVSRPVTLRVTGWSLVRAVLLVGAGLLALGVALAASTVLWWLAIATALAGAFYPVVTWLRRWMPAWAAIITVILGAVAFLGLIAYRFVAELSAQFEIMRNNALAAARSIQSSDQFGQVASEFGLVDKTTRFLQNLPPPLGTGGDPTATVQTAAAGGSAIFAIVTLGLLMLIFGPRFVRAGLDQIDDPAARARVGDLVTSSYHASSRYAWLMAARAVVIGLIGGLLCALLGLETPTALGVGYAVLSLIPGLGIVVATIPIAIYLAVTSPALAIAVICGALVVQALETSFVQQRIDGMSVQVGPTATLIAALLGLQLYGFGGFLIGMAAAVYTLAVLRNLTDSHDEVLTAMRRLVRESDAIEEAQVTRQEDTQVTAGEGTTVIVAKGADVTFEPGAGVDDGDPAGDGNASP